MPGGHYVFSGFESSITDLQTSWMWGHSGSWGQYQFVTHGRLPDGKHRRAFPDQAWAWHFVVGDEGTDSLADKMGELGKILETLLNGAKSVDQLSDKLARSKFDLVYDLTVLEQLGYVEPQVHDLRRFYHLNRPVFLPQDCRVIEEVSGLIFTEYKARGMLELYKELEERYQHTSPGRNGIPFTEGFNALYHAVFERTSDKLFESGLMEQPLVRQDGARYSPWVVVKDDTVRSSIMG